jgi:hypothetical protein
LLSQPPTTPAATVTNVKRAARVIRAFSNTRQARQLLRKAQVKSSPFFRADASADYGNSRLAQRNTTAARRARGRRRGEERAQRQRAGKATAKVTTPQARACGV